MVRFQSPCSIVPGYTYQFHLLEEIKLMPPKYDMSDSVIILLLLLL